MKTLFQMGFHSQQFFPAHAQVRLAGLGQNTIDGNAYLAKINDASNKMVTVNNWVDAHPNYAALLGSDASRFTAMYNQAPSAYDTVTNVSQRISSSDPSTWNMTSVEQGQIDGWIAVMNELYNIVQAHSGVAPTPPGFPNVQLTPVKPGAVPVPGAPVPVASGGISPLAIGAGAAAILAIGLVVLS